MDITSDKIVKELLHPIWASSSDWVRKDYSIFNNNVRDALSKRTLAEFYSHLCRRCGADIKRIYLAEKIEPILNSGQDDAIINLIDKELEVMIISLILYNQENRKNFKKSE